MQSSDVEAKPASGGGKQAKRRARTRGKLIVAATELFSAKGYHGTQVMEIVKEARVGAGTFYTYFPDKAAIYRAILVEGTEQMHRRIRTFRQAAYRTVDPRFGLRSSVQEFELFFNDVLERRAFYGILLRESGSLRAGAHMDGPIELAAAGLAKDLKAGPLGGAMDTRDYDSLAKMTIAVAFQMARSMLATGRPLPARAARLAARFAFGGMIAFSTKTAGQQLSMEDFVDIVTSEALV